MKVLLLIDTLEIGGAETSMAAIFDRFERTEVVVCHLYPGDRLRPRYEAAGVRVLSLGLSGRWAIREGLRRATRVVEAERPDLLAAVLFRSGLVARLLARRTGLPLVDSLVNDSYGKVRFRSLRRAHRLKLHALRLVDRLTARWVTHFVAVSTVVARSNRRALGLPAERVTVVYRGRDAGRFVPASEERRAQARRRLGIGPEQPVLLNTARLLARKGQRELVEAMPAVLRELPGARLLIAGEGPERQALEARIEQLGLGGSVTLLGPREDIPELLAAADLFIFPSHYEGHGGALVEAMLAGLPLVVADTPVHRESIEPGVSGILVPMADPQALARAAVDLLLNPDRARALGRHARAEALERFDLGRIAASHEELYHRIAAGRRP